MKLIADIGTNIYNKLSVELLLPHFFRHYSKLGVTEFILHGNDELIQTFSRERFAVNVDFIGITKNQFKEYQELDKDQAKRIAKNNLWSQYHSQGSAPYICPLWLIQHDIKKERVGIDEYSIICDVDEFIDTTQADIEKAMSDGMEVCRGKLVDMFWAKGAIRSLITERPIDQQMPVKTNFTAYANRAIDKVWMVKGHLKHSFGHHDMYRKKQYKESGKKIDIRHYKWFAENVPHIMKGGAHNHERKLFTDKETTPRLKDHVWNELEVYL